MNPPVQSVIKKNQVRQGQPVLLQRETAAAPGEKQPTVKLVNQAQDAATIEVSCPCGRRHLVRCTYDQPQK